MTELSTVKSLLPGIGLALLIAVPSWLLVYFVSGLKVIGAPIIAILAGMVVAYFIGQNTPFKKGSSFTSKYVLQAAVVFLGFGLNLATVAKVGLSSLPVIVSTISTSLIVAYLFYRIHKDSWKTTALIGVGSSICGGSAIAAAAPVVKADEQEIAQSISVIFLFNVIAALIFPTLGDLLGMSNDGFALFAGTAINDTSSVTAAASTWDSIHGTGSTVLDSATIVKLTRTLFIIPIVIVLSYIMSKNSSESGKGNVVRAFPKFVLLFILASLITTIITSVLTGGALDAANSSFSFLKTFSSFLIVMAMAAVGLGTDIVKLVKSGSHSLLLGLCCWVCIIIVSLLVQMAMGSW